MPAISFIENRPNLSIPNPPEHDDDASSCPDDVNAEREEAKIWTFKQEHQENRTHLHKVN